MSVNVIRFLQATGNPSTEIHEEFTPSMELMSMILKKGKWTSGGIYSIEGVQKS